MNNLNLWIRRTHLYLSLTLLPWFLMYGISSLVISHKPFINTFYGGGQPERTVRFDREYHYDISPGQELREIARDIIVENDLPNMAFGVSKSNPNQISINLHSFLSSIRVTYFMDQNRLLAENAVFRLDQFLVLLHIRGGFQNESVLRYFWSVIVDLFCFAILIWIMTGIYMWWKIRSVRWWGTIAIAGGVLSFSIFLLMM